GWGSWPVLGSFAVGILVLIAYVIRQLKLETPILNLRVFKVKAFTIGAVLVMLDFGIILSAMYLMPMYLQNGLL
ncbi:MFS transporter, partial [Mediterraneibacter sp. 210702-DFI.5.30]|nr:MFS transporter [Mediterraneibacter sp. 210702-DFI.5.30]